MSLPDLAILRARKWLDAREASAYTGKSAATLKRKALAGLISGHKPTGGQWVFDRESIDSHFTPPIKKRAIDIVRSLKR